MFVSALFALATLSAPAPTAVGGHESVLPAGE
jgi:hypothetical protein